MTTVFQKARDGFALVPLVAQGVQALEATLPDSPGKAKFDALWKILTSVFDVAVELLPVAEKLAAAWVEIYGYNKKAQPAA